jgi:hypothetical protein
MVTKKRGKKNEKKSYFQKVEKKKCLEARIRDPLL